MYKNVIPRVDGALQRPCQGKEIAENMSALANAARLKKWSLRTDWST